MRYLDVIFLVSLLGIVFWAVWWASGINKRQKKVEEAWSDFNERRKKLYANLADPNVIEAEMERNATLRDAHLYEARQTLPHEHAGPPARIYRPPLRGVKPGAWRARNPNAKDQ